MIKTKCDPSDALLTISQPELICMPAWRAKVSVNLLKNVIEKASLKWRLFGVIDQEAIAKLREKRIKSGQAALQFHPDKEKLKEEKLDSEQDT
jgi:hypothetical protein